MHVVVAVNGEEPVPALLDAVEDLVRQTGSSITVVSVDDLEEGARSPLPREVHVGLAERSASAAVGALQARGVEAVPVVLSGRAVDRIIELADTQQADVIVVAASRRRPLAERLLGSVPLGLLERARRPVLVVTGMREQS